MEQALIQHVRSRIQADVDFLRSQGLLSQPDADEISRRVQNGSGSGSGAVQDLNSRVGGMALSTGQQPPPQDGGMAATAAPHGQARAIWDYRQTQPDDLGFQKGDIIDITAEENADWWRGSSNGRSGIFPSNHVERISPSNATSPSPAPPASSSSQDAYNNSYSPAYGVNSGYGHGSTTPAFVPPPPTQQPAYAYQQPQSYAWNEKQHQQPDQQQQFVPPPPPPPQHQPNGQPEPPKKNQHKFAKHMGTSFAGGLGFGTGAAVASNAINAIF